MEKRKETTFKGNEITLLGHKVSVGEKAVDFICLDRELKEIKLSDYKGMIKLISTVPSVDTGVCEMQTIRFNQEAGDLKNTIVLTISCDLPFALNRFCANKGIENCKTISDHKALDFGFKYGFAIEELRLLNRGIVVIDQDDNIAYVEYVKENTTHPDYAKALEVVRSLNK